MKKLICIKDVELLSSQGQKIIYVDKNTIITPAAMDLGKNLNIEFKEDVGVDKSMFEGMDSEKLFKVLKVIMEKGLLDDIVKPYEEEVHKSGFKVVRGNSVKMEVLDTGTEGTKACYKEVISAGPLSAGFLNIQDSKFDWEIGCEEMNYIVDGEVTIHIEGESFTAYKGDALYFPQGTKVVWDVLGLAKIFYFTCT